MQFKTTLSKLYPLESYTFALESTPSYPLAPRFCWKFFRPDVIGLQQFGEAIRSYRGKVRWGMGTQFEGHDCIVATSAENTNYATEPFSFYPAVGGLLNLSAFSSITLMPVSEEFIELALADLPDFIRHLEKSLRLEDIDPKPFDERMIAPSQPPSEKFLPPDFHERGMQVAWILVDIVPPLGDGHDTSGRVDRTMLHFGMTEAEWRVIYSDIQSVDNDSLPRFANQFPLLSRFTKNETLHFDADEIHSLRVECLEARKRTSNPLAIRGLDKVILMCNWAKSLGGRIYLAGP